MVDAFTDMSRDEIFSYVQSLLASTQKRLTDAEDDAAAQACWRLANALGAISALVPPDAIGVGKPTILGFGLTIYNDNP